MDFQLTWPVYALRDFEALPRAFRDAILAGEAELNKTGEIRLVKESDGTLRWED